MVWRACRDGLGGDRAGVDDDDVARARPPRAWRCIASDSYDVEPAAEGDDARRPHPRRRRRRTASPAPRQRPVVLRARPGRSSARGRRVSRHSIARSPPGSVTVDLAVRSGPCATAATAAAQAAEPQARVRPAPRSHTRSDDAIGRVTLGERDIGALGKDRVVFEQRPDAVEIIGRRRRRPRRSRADCPC